MTDRSVGISNRINNYVMIKYFKNVVVREYHSRDRMLVEDFRKKSFSEGNNSLSLKKYNPNHIKGKTWMTFVDGNLVSLSVCEASHYTGDPEIAARICRYHILKKYRHCNAGFYMLPYQVNWAKQKGFKIVYWTHDVKNRSLNALYQHKRKMPGKNSFFESELYKSFKLQKGIIFKVSSESNFLQYIYSKTLQPGYHWIPKTNIIFTDHARFDIERQNEDEIQSLFEKGSGIL